MAGALSRGTVSGTAPLDHDLLVIFKLTDDSPPSASPRSLVDELLNLIQQALPNSPTSQLGNQHISITFSSTGHSYTITPAFEDKDREVLYLPQGGQWVPYLSLELQKLSATEASKFSGADLPDLIRLAKLINRQAGSPLKPLQLEAMAMQPMELAQEALTPRLATLFAHYANAIREPILDPYARDLRRLDGELSEQKRERLSLLFQSISDTLDRLHELSEGAHSDEANRLARILFGELITPEPAHSTSPAVWIDLDLMASGTLPEEIAAREGEIIPLRLSDFNPPDFNIGRPYSADEWGGLSAAVNRLIQALPSSDGSPLSRILVTGHASLPVFVQLGMELPRHLPVHTIWWNPARPQMTEWSEHVHPSVLFDTSEPPFFDVLRGTRRSEPSSSRGRIAVWISCVGRGAPDTIVRQFFMDNGEEFAGLVSISTSNMKLLTPSSATIVEAELEHIFNVDIPAAYPAAQGIALFIAGPASLAFLIGRSINPHLLGTVLVPEYRQGKYNPAVHGTAQPALLLPSKSERVGEQLSLKPTHLSLIGFRGLTRMEFAIDPRLTVIFGVNGAGKTSILDALAIMLSQFTGFLIRDGQRRKFRPEDIRVGQSELTVKLHADLNGEETTWEAKRNRGERKDGAHPLGALTQPMKSVRDRLLNENDLNIPVIVYYSVMRGDLDIPSRTRQASEDRPTRLYKDALLKGEAGFRAFFTWFKDQEDAENAIRRRDRAHEDRKLAAVRRAIEGILPGFKDPRIERSPLRMVVDKTGISLSINQLSDGERSVLAMAGDLARRLCDANPTHMSPLDGEAVVLIDELELHLHPGWQRKVLPRLLGTFKGSQFIVTTHSPQVLSHVAVEQVRKLTLDKDGEVVLGEVRGTLGLDSNLLLEEAMDTPRRPSEFTDEFAIIYDLIDNGEIQTALARRQHLADQLGQDYPELTRVDMLIRRRQAHR